MSFAIKNAPETACPKEFWKAVALLILKPALLILKCSLTLIPVG
jgi:hypothetical protein